MTAGKPTATGDHASADPDTAPASDPVVPPGPDGYPLLGSFPKLLRDPFEFFDYIAAYGDVVRYRILRNTYTMLFDPEAIQHVLVEEPGRFERYLFAEGGFDFATEGLLFTSGEQWRNQRRIMQPAFTMDRIQSYAETMQSTAEAMVDRWDDGEELALNREFSRVTLEILAKTLFGIDVDPEAEDEAVTRLARELHERAGPERNVTGLVPNWVPTPANRRYRRALSDYRDQVDDLIAARRGADDPGDDLLSLLVHAEGPEGDTLTDEEIRDNLITFTFAGHDTTSLALTYTFLLLSQHDDARATLEAEHDRVLGGETPRFEHVPQLEYTDRVLTEAMRLYPPAFLLFRKATEDATVRGYDIPEGSIVTLPVYAIHRDERFYDDPDAFRPDRWTESFEDELPEYAYFPFGGGPRHCIGMRFAMLEMKLIVSTVARRADFDLLSDPDPELTTGVTLQPKEDVRMRVWSTS